MLGPVHARPRAMVTTGGVASDGRHCLMALSTLQDARSWRHWIISCCIYLYVWQLLWWKLACECECFGCALALMCMQACEPSCHGVAHAGCAVMAQPGGACLSCMLHEVR